MTLRHLFLSAFVAVFPFQSQALTLECSVQETNAGGGYITELYVIRHDEAAGSAIVSDGLIMYYNNEQPMTAKVSEDSAKKLVVTWDVKMTNRTGQAARMQFRAAYFKSDKTLLLRAIPGGYSNTFEGRGTCKVV